MTSPVLEVKSQEASTKLMKAIVRERYGSPDVLQIKEVEKPAPDDVRGVLVKIYASSVNAADRHDMRGPPLIIRIASLLFRLTVRLRGPKDPRLGTDIA